MENINIVSSPKGILGNLVSNSDRVELCLLRDEFFKVAGDMRGLQIRCQSGKLWITQADDEKDYVLRPGEQFVVAKPGLVLIQSLGEGLVQLISPKASRN